MVRRSAGEEMGKGLDTLPAEGRMVRAVFVRVCFGGRVLWLSFPVCAASISHTIRRALHSLIH